MTEFQYEHVVGKDQYHLLTEMQQWCRDCIGPGGYLREPMSNWSIETAFGTSFFKFQRERDRNWFMMRWS
jgi:hypothetical protein